MKAILVFAAVLMGCAMQGCIANGRSVVGEESQGAEPKVTDPLVRKNYKDLIDLALPGAVKGDPEHQFTVGFLMLEWIIDPGEQRRSPPHSMRDAIDWIRMAAAANLPQAAAVLSSGYRFGDFGLPKRASLADCWSRVELEDQLAEQCVREEGGASIPAEVDPDE